MLQDISTPHFSTPDFSTMNFSTQYGVWGLRVHGWKVWGWEVQGWRLGLNSLGLKCTLTFWHQRICIHWILWNISYATDKIVQNFPWLSTSCSSHDNTLKKWVQFSIVFFKIYQNIILCLVDLILPFGLIFEQKLSFMFRFMFANICFEKNQNSKIHEMIKFYPLQVCYVKHKHES